MSRFDPEDILKYIKSSPKIRAIDEGFLDCARNALAQAGFDALEFLAANPGLSTVQLAMRLNRGANAIGLTIALYREAEKKGELRETAKKLLIGKILHEFPDGWSSGGSVGPLIKLGGWRSSIKRHVDDPRIGEYASRILRELAMNQQPLDGWKPALENDPLVDALFDHNWPNDEDRQRAPVPTEPDDPADRRQPSWFDHKSMLMEKSLGKEHDKVMHALLPYGLGGALDLYYYPNGLPGTAIATKELSPSPNEGSSNDVYRSYELVMFTKHRLNLGEVKEELTEFGRAHAAITAILNDIAPYSAQATLNPNATGEVATDIEQFGGGCVVFDGFACYTDEVVERFGLLAVIRVFRSEMDYARQRGGGALIQLLKARGHYPYSDLDREPVA